MTAPEPKDRMECGCYWTREDRWEARPGIFVSGDVLHRCAAHRAGAEHAGSEPMTDAEMDDLLTTLSDNGFDAEELHGHP